MLIDFYGKECPHCVTMMPLVEKLEKEAGLEVEKYEDGTARKMQKRWKNMTRAGAVAFRFSLIPIPTLSYAARLLTKN